MFPNFVLDQIELLLIIILSGIQHNRIVLSLPGSILL